MTDRTSRLATIAGLLRDRALADLRAAVAAREEARAALDGLVAAPLPPEADPADHANALNHQIWADTRRTEINMTLARRTAEWLAAREAAARAFGRAGAIDRIRGR